MNNVVTAADLVVAEEKTLAEYFTEETYSPYGVIKVANMILKDGEVDKILPGPMGYTYCKKGYIRTVAGSDNKRVTREAAIEWVEKYITKLIKK